MTLERRQPMRRDGKGARKFAASRYQLKRTGMRSAPRRLKHTPTVRLPKPRKRGGDFSPATRRLVAARSGGWCEARVDGVCNGRAGQHHHRKLRSHGDHRPVNDLHVCGACHLWIHAHPRASYRRGYLVESYRDPADIPLAP